MTPCIVIPARYGSTRFPGKPLALVAGVPLLQRVWALAVSVCGPESVVVATDDPRIAAFCATLGATCRMTPPDAPNGTARVHAALQALSPTITHVLNLQGDAVLTPPWVLQALLNALESAPTPCVCTPAVRMSEESVATLRAAKAAGEVGGTTVVFDAQGRALYFSKSVIPFVRPDAPSTGIYRHIGLYGYPREILNRWIALPPGPLEKAEGLEQLRALENGLPLQVVVVNYRGRSHIGLDSPEDARRAERLIHAEGELLPRYDGTARYVNPA